MSSGIGLYCPIVTFLPKEPEGRYLRAAHPGFGLGDAPNHGRAEASDATFMGEESRNSHLRRGRRSRGESALFASCGRPHRPSVAPELQQSRS
mmetsp:Transcript_97648/g.304210  ORF Transcript_97648/g.304210 Transcript_97648/m.304210 type:complete len:93 (-) Transcript_97648:318-596(-)